DLFHALRGSIRQDDRWRSSRQEDEHPCWYVCCISEAMEHAGPYQDRGIRLDDGRLICERHRQLTRKNGERFFGCMGMERDASCWWERLIPHRTGDGPVRLGHNATIRLLNQRLIAMANNRHSCSVEG